MVRIELTLTIMSFDRFNFILGGENRQRPPRLQPKDMS